MYTCGDVAGPVPKPKEEHGALRTVASSIHARHKHRSRNRCVEREDSTLQVQANGPRAVGQACGKARAPPTGLMREVGPSSSQVPRFAVRTGQGIEAVVLAGPMYTVHTTMHSIGRGSWPRPRNSSEGTKPLPINKTRVAKPHQTHSMCLVVR